MKVVTVCVLLVLQATASFLDEFHGAMSNIERGFENLIGNVVSDVKDTIRCTISAVEKVLVLNGVLDKKPAWAKLCNNRKKSRPTNSQDNRSNSFLRKIIQSSNNNHERSAINFSHQLANCIKNVNKTLTNILDKPIKLKSISGAFESETKRLIEISDILKKELEKIYKNVKNKLSQYHFDHKLSAKTIWDEIKELYKIQQSDQNSSEVAEIRSVLNKVANEFPLKVNDYRTHQTLNSINKLEQLKQELQKYSGNEKLIDLKESLLVPETLILKQPSKKYSSSILQNLAHDRFKQKDLNDKTRNIEQNIEKIDNNPWKDYLLLGKSVFTSDLNYFTPPSNDSITNANKLITDSKNSDKVFDNFLKEHHNSVDLFNNPDLLNFGRK